MNRPFYKITKADAGIKVPPSIRTKIVELSMIAFAENNFDRLKARVEKLFIGTKVVVEAFGENGNQHIALHTEYNKNPLVKIEKI